MTDVQKLTKVLRDELTLQTRHCRLLEEQERALLACDRPRFCRLYDEYLQMVPQLEAQADARHAVLQDDAGRACTLTALLEDLPENKRPAVRSIRENLRRTLARAQTLSRRNQQLIQNELQFFAFTLELFIEAGRSADCSYGGRGVVGSRMLLDRRA